MQSRTGSSAIASVFAAHGFWTGGESVTSHNYTTHENQRVKSFVKAKWRQQVKVEPITPDTTDIAAFRTLVNVTYGRHERWCWKGDAYVAPLWIAALKEPFYFVCVKRNISDAVKSLKSKNRLVAQNYSDDELHDRYARKYEYMNQLMLQHDGVVVHIEDVWGGDFTLLQLAIEIGGVDFDSARTQLALDGRGTQHIAGGRDPRKKDPRLR